MKKILFIAFLLITLVSSAQEEEDYGYHFYIGASQGAHLSRINFKEYIDQMFKLTSDQYFTSGYNGGIVFMFYPERNRALHIELNYARWGWSESPGFGSIYSRRLDYLEMPFLSHFDMKGRYVKLFITFGPSISYLLSETEAINLQDPSLMKSYYEVRADQKLEGALCLGLGLTAPLGNDILQLELRIHQGLANIFSSESPADLSTSQHQVASCKLSYLLGLNRK